MRRNNMIVKMDIQYKPGTLEGLHAWYEGKHYNVSGHGGIARYVFRAYCFPTQDKVEEMMKGERLPCMVDATILDMFKHYGRELS
jgi:hypothetical protein